MNAAKQEGQALVLILAFTLVLAVAVVYLFNTSQILAERAQAKVLADHAAYNTAVKQAQLLNANAYMNKAKIANQLATAQSVSVASWAQHFEPIPDNTQWLHLIPVYGSSIHEGLTNTTNLISKASYTSAPFILANNIATKSVSEQQNLLNKISIIEINKIPAKTIKNSSIGTGFESSILPVSSKFAVKDPKSLIKSSDFIKQYQGNSSDPNIGRQRLKDVVLASRDPFTKGRRADNQWDLPSWMGTIVLKDLELHRRGGTEISNDLNQWKGVDTVSFHYERYKCKKWFDCDWRHYEEQIGYGSAVMRNDNTDNDSHNNAGYSDVNINNDASDRSGDFIPTWDTRTSDLMNKAQSLGETGIPRFWDLDSQFLGQDEPTLPVSIRVTKNPSELDTTSGSSEFKVGEELDISSSNKVTAISTAEVYFERPLQDRKGVSTFLNKKRLEKSSLFNPYWQVKLINNSSESIIEANAL